MLLIAACAINLYAQKDNTLTPQEKKDGWRKCNATDMTVNWSIEEEAMKVSKGEVPGQEQDGDIFFGNKKYKNQGDLKSDL